MSNEITAANATPPQKVSVLNALASKLECDPKNLLPLLKKTAFSNCRNDEEFMTMCMVANTYSLNPLLKEIYAFPNNRNGAVIPIVSVDGWNRIMNNNPAFDGIEFEDGVKDGDAYCTAIVYRKDRAHPVKVTEWLGECKGSTDPWNKWPHRMLRHKALIQGARIAFGFAGIYDEDEGRRIREVEAVDVTPVAEPKKGQDALKAALGVSLETAPEESHVEEQVPVQAELRPEDVI